MDNPRKISIMFRHLLLFHVLQKLALCRAGIPDDTHVYVATETSALCRDLWHSAKEHQHHPSLNFITTWGIHMNSLLFTESILSNILIDY